LLDRRGDETLEVLPHPELLPQSDAMLVIHPPGGPRREVPLVLRMATPLEVAYYRAGGILPYGWRQLLTA